ncbi:MAG: extracellular solute-binding protein [Chloroflexi bacterium]|nr:extracellular solute-binding protein [Chloroflexota bacterium]
MHAETPSVRSAVTRRRFLMLAAVGAGASLLAACQQSASTPAPSGSSGSSAAGATAAPAKPTAAAQGASGQPAATQAAPAAKTAGATVKFGVLANYKGDAIEKMMPDFEKQSGIKVAIDKLPANNLVDKLTVSYAAGNPDYDLSMMDEPWVPGLAAYLTNVDEYVTRDKLDLKQFHPNALSAGVFNNERVAMPLDPNVMMLWFRKDLLEAKGVKTPTTFAEIIDAAEKLNDPANDIAGISVTGKKDAQVSTTAIVLLWNNGQEVITSDGKFGFDSPAGVTALETYQRILKSAPPGVLGYGPTEQLDAFYNGKAAMVFYWASIGPNATDPQKSKAADKVGWAGVPNGMRGVWTLGIPKDSKNKDAAWEVIKWMTSPEGSLLFTNYGAGHSPRYDVLNNADFQKKYPWAPDLIKALDAAKARPQTPNWTAIETAITDMGTAVLSGQKSPKDAIKDATNQVAPYLKS